MHIRDKNTAFEFHAATCGACGGSRSRVLGKRGGEAHRDGVGVLTTIVQCVECSHMFPDPMPMPAKGYGDLYEAPAEYFQGHDIERKKQMALNKLQEVERMLEGRGRYLDVGCGRGEALWAARERGWECEGVDPSPSYLEWGRENLGVEGRLGTLEEAQFPRDHFDAVTMGSVLEHVYEPYSMLSEVQRVLKPGGVLWFDVPNESSLYTRIGNYYMRILGRDWVVNLAPTFPPYHVQGFNPRSVKTLLGRVGLEVERLQVWGYVWPPAGASSIRKRLEYVAAQTVNWIGNHFGAGFYMDVWARKPLRSFGN